MELIYKTRGMSDPRGKARVYFTCHPKDFDMFFPMLSDDILKHANCAVWYDADRSSMPDEEELSLVLDEIQIVVVGISSLFLHEYNRAKDIEFPMALKKRKPILPILMENEIYGEFNEVGGGIQAVMKYSNDPTAKTYDEVMGTFIKSVLVENEIKEKVREAFDAYVFLSYRKKDRDHAHRLIRMIHENEEFRDIAIWYDEFLVPGEGFEKAILKAFEKSSLFAMAVTPSLQEKGNYVMSVEYPLARDRKEKDKKFEIIPVELYQSRNKVNGKDWRIDLSELKEHDEFKYHSIENLQDEHRRVQMDEAFINALRKIAIKENDGSKLHKFFIGLAYLCGIDCEIDYKTALRLITEAASPGKPQDGASGEVGKPQDGASGETGAARSTLPGDDPDEEPCIEAIAKLSEMYWNGEGVAIDRKEAARWQEKLAEQYLKRYEKNHDPDEHKGYGTKYFKALRKLADMQSETGQRPEAMQTARKALDFCKVLDEEVGVREQDRDKAVVLNILGKLHEKNRDYEAASKCIAETCRIYERLAWEIGTSRARRDLSISYERMGDLLRKKGDLNGADEYYRKAKDLREALCDAEPSPDRRRDVSSVLTKMGNVRKKRKEYNEAAQYYSKALDMDELLAEEVRTPQARDDHGVSLTKVGDIHKAEGRLDEAGRAYERAKDIFYENYRKTGSLRFLEHYAGACEKLASIQKKKGALQKASELYRESLDLREKLYRETGSKADRYAYGVALYNAGLFFGDEEMVKTGEEMMG